MGAINVSNEFLPPPLNDDFGMDLRSDAFCFNQDNLSPVCVTPASSRRCSLTIEPLCMDLFSCPLQDKQISLELSSDQKSLVLPLSIDGEPVHPEATSLDLDMNVNMNMDIWMNMNMEMNMDMNMDMNTNGNSNRNMTYSMADNANMNMNQAINTNLNQTRSMNTSQGMEIEGESSADSAHFQRANDEDSSYKDPNDECDSVPTPRQKTNHTWEETAKQLQLNVCVPEMSMYNVPSMCSACL